MATSDNERLLMDVGGWFDTLVTRAPIPKVVHTLDGERIVALSDAFTALTGYTLEDIPTGLDWMMRGRGLDRDTAHETLAEAVAMFRAGPPFPEHEGEIFTKSGERRVWLFHVAGLLAGFDGARLVVTSAVDITERKRVEERLVSHQRFVDAIFATNPNVLYVFDLRAQAAVYQNRLVAEAIGYSAEEVRAMGTRVLETLAHPEDLPRIQAHFRRIAAAEDDELHSLEHRMQHREGSWRWFYAQDTVFARDEAGTPTQILGTSTDITAQKQAELALAESRRELEASEARYRAVVEDIPMLLCRFDPEGRITFANRGYCEALGRSEEELLGKPFLFLVPEEDRKSVWRDILSLAPERPTKTVEHRVTAKDGHERWQQWTNRAIFGADSQPVAYQSIGQDITDEVEARREREALHRELRRHRHQLGQALKAAQAGAWTWETEANRFLWSPETYDMLAMAPDTDPMDLKDWLERVHEEDRTAVHRAFVEAAAQGRDIDVTYRFRRPDGEYRWIRDVARTLAEGNGITGIRMDVTHQQDLEDRLRQSQKLEAIGQLAAGVAHDVNNLLVPIELSVDICARDATVELRERLEPIREASRRAAGLTRQILAFARRQVLDARQVALGDVVRQFVPMLHRLLGERIEIVAEIEPGTPDILGDRSQLEQVLLNLAVNARDAMPNGGTLTIEVRRCPPISPDDTQHGVVLESRDTGIGMDERTRAHLFEPFFTTKPRGRGTGLGLATVHGIVKQHDATISVESEVGRGTAIRLVFPPVDATTRRDSMPPPEPTTLFGSERVLVVEDDPLVRRSVADLLTLHGYQVDTAENGRAAIGCTSPEASHDLLLTDVVMPDMDGRELYQCLRARCPSISVLYMSGYNDRILAPHGVLTAHTDLLMKPFAGPQLLTRVRQVLDAR